MRKFYKVVPLPGSETTHIKPLSVSSETDLGALEQAKQLLGADVPFELWNGLKLALTYKPMATPRKPPLGL